MARVNFLQRVKTSKGWSNVPLKRTPKGNIKWPSGGRYLIEWRGNGRRLRKSAGDTPAEALKEQNLKELQLKASVTGFEIKDLRNDESRQSLVRAVDDFLKDIKTFRKPLTHQKYTHILQLFCEHVAPKSDVREITGEDIKNFLAWRKSKGFDPGTTVLKPWMVLQNLPYTAGTVVSVVACLRHLPCALNQNRLRHAGQLPVRPLPGAARQPDRSNTCGLSARHFEWNG